jgi:hypothetical protein
MQGDVQSVLDWMGDRDFQLRQALEPVSLVVETNFDAEDIQVAKQHYGLTATHMLRRGHRHSDVITKYPALTLMILVGHAAVAYDQGRYWEEFWESLDMERDSNFENALRHHLAPLLQKFQLARFPDLERENRYVMMLALHAGIPVNCLDDLLRMVDAHLVRGNDARGAALVEWLEEPGKQHRSDPLDVPVRNFIRYGGPFGLDILDRIFDFVESVADDPQLLSEDLDTSTTGLPSVLLNELVQRVRAAPLAWKGKRRSPTVSHSRPTLCYAPDDDQVYVKVPYPTSHPDVPWRVSFDGHVREVFAERVWGAGEAVQPPTLVPVPLPAREVVLIHLASGASYSRQIVDKNDPLLTFDADGNFLSRRNTLGEQVWAIYPSDAEVVDATSLEAIDALADADAGGMPGGWRGWRSKFLDLSSDSIQLRRGQDLLGGTRSVRRGTAARFQLGERMEGCETLDGRAVYHGRPWIVLPPSRSRNAVAWRIRTRRFGEDAWLVDAEWLAEDVETSVDPFDDAEESQLGLFEIAVTGPLGADIRTVVFLAEGVYATFEPAFRLPAARGLSSCIVALESTGSLSLADEWIEFGTADSDRVIELSEGNNHQSLVLRPPRIEMRCTRAGLTARWSTSAEICSPSDLTHDLKIAVRLPPDLSVDFAFVTGAGDVSHVEQPRRTAQRVFDVAAQRFADTARRALTGHLMARVFGGEKPVSVAVLSIQPPRLCTGMRLDGGAVVLSSPVDDANLALHIWRATAPWQPPDYVPVDNGSGVLPGHLIGTGELICQAFIDDPWISVEPPTRPAGSAARLSQPGWTTGHSKELNDLSRYLAGQGPPPASVGEMPEVWNALAVLQQASPRPEDRNATSALVKALTQDPRKALEGLGSSAMPTAHKMAHLIQTELVNQDFATASTANDLHPDPWFGCIIEMADLKSLYRRRILVPDERAETLGYLGDKGGQFLLELLRSGVGAGLSTDCFDHTTPALASWPADRVDDLRTHLRLVPGSLLDPDMRRAANFDAFARRSDWLANRGWSVDFARKCDLAVNQIRRACPNAASAIAARKSALRGVDTDTHPWMLMCVQSLTLAFLARVEARGTTSGQHLDSGLLFAWSELAAVSPSLVATDILIAEAIVVHSSHGDLVGERNDRAT